MIQDLERLRSIKSFPSLVKYLRDELDWEFETDDIEDLTYDYSTSEFALDTKSAASIREIKQLRPLLDEQPWGIFYLDFSGQAVSITALRGILRSLVAKKRASANQSETKKWRIEDLLFICTSDDFKNFNFAYFRGADTNRAVLSSFGWHQGDTHVRTLLEYNLEALRFPSNTSDREGWLGKWRAAFDVEKVTDEFFRRYNDVFTAVEQEVKSAVQDDRKARLFTQKLFNRLMFICFIQKKGWLSFKDAPKSKYLRALFNDALAKKENFFIDRLYWLFFRGMSVADLDLGQTEEQLREKRGEVPPLNGGLFELEDELDVRGRVPIKNEVFGLILDLFERYNFTIEESTPLDVQVAVDPEMLGKVFEELVTGRHETGSYYTPRPIVSFMCREALKHYLNCFQPSKEAVAKFVDEEDASDLQNPEAVLDALKRVRVCDPACGSGAYLLGMLHELMRLRAALFRSKKIDDATLYERKRWIIENNLYGVDIDKFAVQIAHLRLWLSLAIDSDEPRPLPNLDFKIECGDSLIAPAPSEAEKQMTFARTAMVNEFRLRKGEYMRENDPERKRQLRQRIDNLRSEIALALKHQLPPLDEGQVQKRHQELSLLEKNIASARNPSIKTKLQKQAEKVRATLTAHAGSRQEIEIGFDWAVEFAEVFMPAANKDKHVDMFTFVNDYDQQPVLIEDTNANLETSGFDIVLANPPYVRMELFKRIKPTLRRNFPAVHSDRADLYVYFYDRAQQLLKNGGIGVFISPHKWLRAVYGEGLRQHLLDKQKFRLVVEFGDLPVFKATAYPAIFVWQKDPRNGTPTVWAVVKDLAACYNDGVREHILSISKALPADQFGEGKPRLIVTAAASRRVTMEASGDRLSDYATGQIMMGIKTGRNQAFVIDSATRAKLIEEDARCEEVIKPLLGGDDVRRYEAHYRSAFLLYMFHGVQIHKYPPIEQYLKTYKTLLENRATRQEWYELQQPQLAYAPFFDRPKIIYPDIGNEVRFVIDNAGRYGLNTTYSIARTDWYLLGVLNSSCVEDYFREITSPIRGGYMRFFGDYMETLPIPNAGTDEREAVAKLARQTQDLHAKRRKRVEQFLRSIGIQPAESSCRNPLEQPWRLSVEEFTRRARRAPLKIFNEARDETIAFTEKTARLEREIDERVAALYGVPLDPYDRTSTNTGIDPAVPLE